MKHEILGDIEQPNGAANEGTVMIRFQDREIKVRLDGDDQPFSATVQFAADVVRQLELLDQQARQIAVRDLRDTYNNGWNEYDEVQDDGSLKTITNPPMSAAEFEQKLSLRAINVMGRESIDLFYDDRGMFWGHSIVVNSLNGTDLSGADAQLFG